MGIRFGFRAIACAAAGTAAFASVAPVSRSGFDVAGMDRTVRPGDDFFSYANGAWDRRTPIPADRASTGTISALDDRSREQVRTILDEAARQPDNRLGLAYRAFLDKDGIERKGLEPIAPRLATIRAIRTRNQWLIAAADAGRHGISLPLAFAAEPDDGNPDRYALIISQAGLGMPDRDYYLAAAPDMQAARIAYRAYLATTLRIAGVLDPDAGAARVLAFETKLAQASWTAAASRDAQRTYNPMKIADIAAGWAAVALPALVHNLGYRTDHAVVRQPDAVAGIARAIAAEPVETLRDSLLVRTLHRYAETLPAAVRDADFAFYGRVVGGVDAPEPRWRQAIAFVLEAMPDDVSRIYVARHFTSDTRAAAKVMVDNLVAAFGRRIDAVDWMAPDTKLRARRKLAAFRAQIGYPDRWHDYSGLVLRADDALGNAMRAAQFQGAWEAAKIGRPVYRWEWSATPMTVDAFANYPKVSIVFPAAILQPPFFDPDVDPAVNYGGIGASIAHEMTHHFDDQGARYDETGRLMSWWSASDKAAFASRTTQLAAQYDSYRPMPGMPVNGRLTLGENIADLGGLAIAYDAYSASLAGRPAPVINGLTGDQRFFLGWAQIWRLKYRDADMRRRLLTNPHAPAAQRVSTVRNLDQWYAAFNVRPTDKLYLRSADRVHIW